MRIHFLIIFGRLTISSPDAYVIHLFVNTIGPDRVDIYKKYKVIYNQLNISPATSKHIRKVHSPDRDLIGINISLQIKQTGRVC